MWQNVLQLWVFEEVEGRTAGGKMVKKLRPLSRQILDRNMAAAIFCKYGFDSHGLLPYDVFILALCETPARLLSHEIILDKAERGKNGLENEVDIALCVGEAKVLYPKSKSGVFPPSGFDPQVAFRSMMAPRAHMYLEHVYGYAGALRLMVSRGVVWVCCLAPAGLKGCASNPNSGANVQRLLALPWLAMLYPMGLVCFLLATATAWCSNVHCFKPSHAIHHSPACMPA